MATVTATVPDLSGENLTSWLQAEHKTVLDLLRAAWGITLVSYTGSEDVWFRSCSQSGGNSLCHSHASATQPVRSLFEIQPHENAPEDKGTVVWGQDSVVFEGEGEGIQDTVKQFDLAVSFHQDTISISLEHNPAIIPPEQARMMAATAARAVAQIVRQTNSTISDLDLVSETDIARISQWNSSPHKESGRAECIHEVIAATASSQPSTAAVSSWDGDLTYGELERLSSALAVSLRHLGVRREVFVPLVFDKSKWAIVALLGVLKAGGAYFFLNPTHPVKYNKTLCEPFDIKLAVCSPKHHLLAQSFAPRLVELGNEAGEDLEASSPGDENPPSEEEESPNPSQAMYATFTSGTTGTPKSITTSHDAFYHMAMATASPRALDISPATRMLQFASYTFDVANRDMLIPLMFGGCVCVPSERERVEDLGGFIERRGVTLASLTPSMAGTLRPASVPSLKGLVLGGEQMTESHLQSWTSDEEDNRVGLFNAYGVSESTGIAALARVVQPGGGGGGGSSPSNIGRGNGSTLWVLSMTDPRRLAPVGAVGELVIEGPSVARGYLNDPDRTERCFQTEPEWKRAFLRRLGENDKSHERFPWTRAFRTGDLVRYSPRLDGTLELMGRRDHQVKVNGQRLELAAVEGHVAACTQLDPSTVQYQHAAVVAVKAKGRGGGTKLVAFLGVETSRKSSAANLETILEGSWGWDLQEVMKNHLSQRMPAFMVPSEFVFLQHMPLTSSGKIDRVLLQETAVRGLSNRQNRTSAGGDGNGQAGSEMTTAAEKILVQAWARTLDIDEEGISREDCFFRRGGDSIAAIKLAAHLREKGIQINVEDVFKHSTFSDMAALPVVNAGTALSQASSSPSPQPPAVPPPFSLLKAPQAIIPAILEEVGLSRESIEDVYPATHIQAGLIALTAQHSSAYIGSYTWPVRHEVSAAQLKQAWEKVWRMNPVLRTRVLQVPEGVFQVVVASGCDIPWTMVDDVDEPSSSVDIAVDGKSPLVRFYLSKEAFRLDIHHALFDEWSLDLLLAQVEKAYAGQPLPHRPFSPFVQNLLAQEQNDAAEEFWREQFAGLRTERFPPGSSTTSSAAEKIIFEHSLSLMTSAHSRYTLSTTLRLAWAIILSHQTDSPDVVFGATVTGRNADNLQLTGPTLATLPVRLKVPGDQAIHEALEEAQRGFANMMAHQQTGLPRIRAASSETADACGFQNLLVVQQQQTTTTTTAKTDNRDSSRSRIFETSASTGGSRSPDNAKAFASYPLVLTCRPSQHSISFTAAVDPTLLDPDGTRGILRQMAHVVQQILSSEAHDLRIKDLHLMPRQDVEQLSKWNGILPAGVETPIHHTIRNKAESQPDKVAVHSHGLDLSYAQVERYSNLFSQHLLAAGVSKGDFVPLLLERSPWAPVLMLAVLKLGAAFALLDLSHPVQRLRTMCTVLSAKRVVCFPHHRTMVERDLLLPEVVFDPETVTHVSKSKSTRDAPAGLVVDINMDAPACVVFSSGSTGLPKAIQLPHRALSTSAYHLSTTGHLSQSSRVFHFASFAFDLSIGELLFSLSAGATVCVPTEEERRANPSKAAGDLGVTWALLTPSVIGLLDPEDVPTLQVLASAGEQLTTQIVETWAGRVRLFNMYAPAECTVISHISRILPGADTPPACIGRSPGAVSWVACQDDHRKLVPIGTVGELLVEGPVVSSGYLGDAEKTDAVFLSPSNPPSWLTQIRGEAHQGGKFGRVYKTGDLVRQREDGTLLFLGRKDDQIKLHGQRLEVEEVEHGITSLCSSVRKVAVDCVKIPEKGGGKRASLVAFVAPQESEDWGRVGKEGGLEVIQDPNDNFYTTIESLYTSLQDTLPSYMLPSYFLPLSNIPLSLSGKVNRKLLREESTTLLGSQHHREKYQLRTRTAREQAADGEQVPLTEHETQILQIIAQVLHLDANQVPINGNFFGIGGDSISAMRVAALARRKGLGLGVADIFKHQILSHIAASCCPESESESDTDSTSRDLSESSSTTDSTPRDLSESSSTTDSNSISEKTLACELPPGLPQEVAQQVELALPATDFQTMTLYNFYSRYLWVSLPDTIDTERLQQACQRLTEKHSILRTVFYTTTTTTSAASVVQIVLRSLSVGLVYYKDIESLEQHFTADSMSHGPPINGAEGFQVQLLSLRGGQERYLALRLPHAQFDGLSLGVLIDDLSAAYDDDTGRSLAPCAQFSDQVKCVTETKTTHEAYQVWKDVLEDAEMTRLDGQSLRRGDGEERKEEGEESVVTAMTETAPLVAPAGTTMATLVKLAWALTLSRFFLPKQPNERGSEGGRSVVFGQVIHGRSLSLPYEDRIVGPCLNIIPVRVLLPPTTPNLDDPVGTRVLLEQVQSQHLATLPVENLSLSTITKHCTHWAPGTQFGSFVRFQNFEDDDGMRCSLNGESCETGLWSLPNKPSRTANVLIKPKKEGNLEITLTVGSMALGQQDADHVVGCLREVLESLAGREKVV